MRARFSEMATNAVIIFVHTFISYIKFTAVFPKNYLEMHITVDAFTY